MRGNSTLNNEAVFRLLESWGFVLSGSKGRHLVMSLNGRRVLINPPESREPIQIKALRKAARIKGVTLKRLLAGPIEATEVERISLGDQVIEQKDETMETIEVPDQSAVEEFSCDICGKNYSSRRGLTGHKSTHQMVRCHYCGNSYTQAGIGSHRRGCAPKKRSVGRPRKPIAEVIERKKVKGNIKTGVDVPEAILEDLDEEFPPAEAFKFEITVPDAVTVTPDPELLELVDDDPSVEDLYSEVQALADIFLPGYDLDESQTEEFLNWVEATRILLSSLYTPKI